MKVEQRVWNASQGWKTVNAQQFEQTAVVLVLAFGSSEALSSAERYAELKRFYPAANIVCCTTSGEILGSKILDNTIVASALYFEKTSVRVGVSAISKTNESYQKGYDLAKQMMATDLVHLFVLSDGHIVNGTDLVKGLNAGMTRPVVITGGLAGDGNLLKRTLVGVNAPPAEGQIAVVGYYGSDLMIGHGSKGGWDTFGHERTVTRSHGNVLYEFDNKSALGLYKQYLGAAAAEPAATLLFPVALRLPDSEEVIVRTVMSVDEENQSLTFADDLPVNSKIRLMRANFDRLIDGAVTAADHSLSILGSFQPEFAILISCVGRRLVLNDRTVEEVEEATRTLGDATPVSGFYSYGEISPVVASSACELHNQTMTITVYCEK